MESVPVRDSVLAIADESYFDWAVLPEAPSLLTARAAGTELSFPGNCTVETSTHVAIERRVGVNGAWERIATLAASAKSYRDSSAVSAATPQLSRAGA